MISSAPASCRPSCSLKAEILFRVFTTGTTRTERIAQRATCRSSGVVECLRPVTRGNLCGFSIRQARIRCQRLLTVPPRKMDRRPPLIASTSSTFSGLGKQRSDVLSWGVQRKSHISAPQAADAEFSQTIFFSENGIERSTDLREDSAWLTDAFNQQDALVVPLLENKSLVKQGRAVFLPTSTVQGIDHIEPIFLGLSQADKVPIFAVDVKDLDSTDGIKQIVDNGAEWVDVRRYGSELQASEAGLLAYARGMVEWKCRNRHCGHCGGVMVIREGGHSLTCSSEACGRLSFPRMDPAVIMLITSGNYVLLGRQARWDAGLYSLLAGFVEIGETFELAVAREVMEEAGVDVDLSSVRYAASQPWPFPSSLMVGFTGTVKMRQVEPYNASAPPHGQAMSVGVDRVPEVDEVNLLPKPVVNLNELEEARWVHRSFVRSSLFGEALPHDQNFRVPGKYTIANHLLRTWIADETLTEWAGSDVPTVDIDEGNFKYVLIRIRDDQGNQKLVVRGKRALDYHTDIVESTYKQLHTRGIQVEQLGGGRIDHQPISHTLHIFSSSQAFGQADHTVTNALLRQSFPMHSISISWDP